MYKTKLQEYCQSHKWSLPEYRTSREGPDHSPCFHGVVDVNGLIFVSPQPCHSSKTAQNEAAKAAFDHFTGSATVNVGLPLPASSGILLRTTKDSAKSASFSEVTSTTKEDERRESAPAVGLALPITSTSSGVVQPLKLVASEIASVSEIISTKDDERTNDMAHMYKNQLQIYAQKRNLPTPVYASESEGPPHSCRFKSKVTVDGKTFESPEFFKTVKEAENSAARVAVMSLPADDLQQDCPSFSKNLLQEYVQKAYKCLPMYNTIESGVVSHVPSFVSTVEIRGETFQGEQAKTKKQAEMNAAKVAYTAMMARESKSYANEEIIYSPKSQSNKQATDLGGEAVQEAQLASTMRRPGPGSPSDKTIEPKEEGSSSIPSTLPAATHAKIPCNSVAGAAGPAGPVPSKKKTRHLYSFPRKGEFIPIPPGTTLFHADDEWYAVEKIQPNEGE